MTTKPKTTKAKAKKDAEDTKPPVPTGPLDLQDMMSFLASNTNTHVEGAYSPVDFIETGCISFDAAVGGLGRGVMTQIAGPAGAGKTTLATVFGINAVRAGLRVAVVNQEYRWNPTVAFRSGMGSPGKEYLLFSCVSGEDVLNNLVKLFRNEYDLIIVDSVAAMPSRKESESEEIGEGGAFGAMAKMWSEWFRVHAGTLSRGNTALILLNQFRTKMNITYGSPISRPGGKALEFYSSVAIDLVSVDAEHRFVRAPRPEEEMIAKDGKIVQGLSISGATWKNIFAPNFRKFDVPVYFHEGGVAYAFQNDIADWGKALRIFTNSDGVELSANSHWYYKGEKIGNRDAVRAWAIDPINAHKIMDIRQSIREAIQS